MSEVSEANKRQKRTLGTILGFFGFKLVPLNSQDVETFPAQANRAPKVNRIQTMIPSFDDEPTSETPTTTSAKDSTTTETSEAPMTTSSDPLRIIFGDSIVDSLMTSTEMPSVDETTIAEGSSEESSTDSQEIELLARFSSLPLNMPSDQLPPQMLQSDPSQAMVAMPINPAPPQPMQMHAAPPQMAQMAQTVPPPKGFDFFRSTDATSQYFDQQTFDISQRYLMPPRTFAAPRYIAPDQYQAQSAQSGQYFNYVTYHWYSTTCSVNKSSANLTNCVMTESSARSFNFSVPFQLTVELIRHQEFVFPVNFELSHHFDSPNFFRVRKEIRNDSTICSGSDMFVTW